MTTDTVTVEPPKHPLHALTTFELADYRRRLEDAIGFYEGNHPAAPALPSLRDALTQVTAEQDNRVRIAARNV